MFEAILGMILLGGAVIMEMADNDFDLEKMADKQMKKQDEIIDRKIKEVDKKFRDMK